MKNKTFKKAVIFGFVIGFFGCKKEAVIDRYENKKLESHSSYEFEKDQTLPVSNDEAIDLITNFSKEIQATQKNNTLYTLQEGIFLAEGTTNYIKGNPEQADTRNTRSVFVQRQLPLQWINGSPNVTQNDLTQIVHDLSDDVDANLNSNEVLVLIDVNIESISSSNALLEVLLNAAPGDINWIDSFDDFPASNDYWSISTPNNPVGEIWGNPSTFPDYCVSADSPFPSWKLINRELNELYFPISQRQEGYTYVNLTVINGQNALLDQNELYPNGIPCSPYSGCSSSWGCEDFMFMGDGQFFPGLCYPHGNQLDITACVSGEQMNNYMAKVIEWLSWRLAVSDALGNPWDAVTHIQYGYTLSPTTPSGPWMGHYLAGHRFSYMLGQQLVGL